MTITTLSTAYDRLIKNTKETTLFGSTIGLIGWDQEVMMPKKGIEYRSDQIAMMARMYHEMSTDEKIGDWLSACEEDADLVGDQASVSATNIRELRHSYDRATKLLIMML